MDGQIEGRPTAEYLWGVKGVVPFLKVDKGLADEAHRAKIMKPMPKLDALLDRAVAAGIFGTKMRSVILGADPRGVRDVVDQQFEVAGRILAKGLVPIIEPEVDIHAPDKAEAEELLIAALTEHLDALPDGDDVMLKVTIPSVDGRYGELTKHPRVMRVVALSGGYEREDANARLARNPGLIAVFSARPAGGPERRPEPGGVRRDARLHHRGRLPRLRRRRDRILPGPARREQWCSAESPAAVGIPTAAGARPGGRAGGEAGAAGRRPRPWRIGGDRGAVGP